MISKKDTYYIASGFFNPEQIETVDKIEDSLKGLNLNYFSPRSESIAFFKEKNPEYKSMMTKLIFNNNLDCINSCNKFIVNLQNNDQGTLFEYGYIASKNESGMDNPYYNSSSTKVMNDKLGLERLVLKCGDNLLKGLVNRGKDSEYISHLLESFPIIDFYRNRGELAILCIDDRDPINLFLIGYCYGNMIPVITYSHEGHGSNVMLVHSSTHAETIVDLNKLLKNIELELEECVSYNNLDTLDELSILNIGRKGLSSIYLNDQEWNKNID